MPVASVNNLNSGSPSCSLVDENDEQAFRPGRREQCRIEPGGRRPGGFVLRAGGRGTKQQKKRRNE
jgi:hypothetical protein